MVVAACTSKKLVVVLFTFLCAPLGCKALETMPLLPPSPPTRCASHALHFPFPAPCTSHALHHALPLWNPFQTLTPCNPPPYAPQVLEPYRCLRASFGGPVFSEEEEVQGELGELQGPRYLETLEYEIAE